MIGGEIGGEIRGWFLRMPDHGRQQQKSDLYVVAAKAASSMKRKGTGFDITFKTKPKTPVSALTVFLDSPKLLFVVLAMCGDVCDLGRMMCVCKRLRESVENNKYLWKWVVQHGGVRTSVRGAFWCHLTGVLRRESESGLGLESGRQRSNSQRGSRMGSRSRVNGHAMGGGGGTHSTRRKLALTLDENSMEMMAMGFSDEYISAVSAGRASVWTGQIERDVLRTYSRTHPLGRSGARALAEERISNFSRGPSYGAFAPASSSPSLTTAGSSCAPTPSVNGCSSFTPPDRTTPPPLFAPSIGGGVVAQSPLACSLRARLGRVLLAVAGACPEVGYCQGLDYVAAHLLCTLGAGTTDDPLPEQRCYWLICALFQDYGLARMYEVGLVQLRRCCAQFSRLLQLRLPALAAHLQQQGVVVEMFGIGWFQTLFLYVDPLPCSSLDRLWDVFLLERSWKIVFRAGLGLLAQQQQQLLKEDFTAIMARIAHLPCYWLLKPTPLIRSAYSMKVTNTQLAAIEHQLDREQRQTGGGRGGWGCMGTNQLRSRRRRRCCCCCCERQTRLPPPPPPIGANPPCWAC